MRRDNDENDLVAEITFNIKDLKIYWIKRLPEGYIIVRMFEKGIEVHKDFESKGMIEVDFSNPEGASNALIAELKNILMK